MDAQHYTGGCLCGSVRYTCSAEPAMSGNCHCRDCQKTSGGPYVPFMFFPAAAVDYTGTVRYYKRQGDSGKTIERGFCAQCGSQLFTKVELLPDLFGVKAGTLDDAARFAPNVDIYAASAAPWDHMNPALPKMPGSPLG